MECEEFTEPSEQPEYDDDNQDDDECGCGRSVLGNCNATYSLGPALTKTFPLAVSAV